MKWTDRMSSVIVVISFSSLLPHGITPLVFWVFERDTVHAHSNA